MPEQTPKRAAEQIGHVDLRRAWRAFLKPGRGQLLVGAVLCLAALLVVWTLRSQASQPDYSNLRRTDLIQLLDNLSAETRRLETEVRELTTTRDQLESGAAGAKAADDEARHRTEQLQIISGTVPPSCCWMRWRSYAMRVPRWSSSMTPYAWWQEPGSTATRRVASW